MFSVKLHGITLYSVERSVTWHINLYFTHAINAVSYTESISNILNGRLHSVNGVFIVLYWHRELKDAPSALQHMWESKHLISFFNVATRRGESPSITSRGRAARGEFEKDIDFVEWWRHVSYYKFRGVTAQSDFGMATHNTHFYCWFGVFQPVLFWGWFWHVLSSNVGCYFSALPLSSCWSNQFIAHIFLPQSLVLLPVSSKSSRGKFVTGFKVDHQKKF